jgi:tetratricopeptide (TPR) repeat protein
MKKQIFLLAPCISFLILTSCKSSSQKPAEETTPANTAQATKDLHWPNQMQELTKNLSDLLPLVADPQQYSAPEKRPMVSKTIESIKKLAHNITDKSPTPDKDPSIRFIAQRFEQNIQLSLDSYQSGHYEFSRSILKGSMSQCVQCHTRLEIGPTLTKPDYLTSLKDISIVDRIQFLVASRYFKEALEELDSALKNSEQLSIVSWQKLVQLGLIIHVRFSYDIKESDQFINRLNKNANVPFFIKRNIPFWQNSIAAWKSQTSTLLDLKSASDLIQKGEKLSKESRSDGGLIEYLRAAHFMHMFLANEKPQPIKAQALYHLGLIYENIGEAGSWSMNEDYYELCIRTEPHSEIAQKCFAKYQESLIAGYSGTGGLFLPADMQKKMNELRAMAL